MLPLAHSCDPCRYMLSYKEVGSLWKVSSEIVGEWGRRSSPFTVHSAPGRILTILKKQRKCVTLKVNNSTSCTPNRIYKPLLCARYSVYIDSNLFSDPEYKVLLLVVVVVLLLNVTHEGNGHRLELTYPCTEFWWKKNIDNQEIMERTEAFKQSRIKFYSYIAFNIHSEIFIWEENAN